MKEQKKHSNNGNVKAIIALVTASELARTADKLKVRFAESSVSSMNMVAFD